MRHKPRILGYRAIRPDGSTARTDSRIAAEQAAGPSGRVVRIKRNHNGTRFETPVDRYPAAD